MPISTAQLGTDAAQELIQGRLARRIGNVMSMSEPYGLRGTTDFPKQPEESYERYDFDAHPGILEELEVIERDQQGDWSTRELGWADSKLGGHRILWAQPADVDANGIDDLIFCASSVDTDQWYKQLGTEKGSSFEPEETDAFLAGTLRVAIADDQGNLSLADSAQQMGNAKPWGCAYDDYRYTADVAGDGRTQLLLVRGRVMRAESSTRPSAPTPTPPMALAPTAGLIATPSFPSISSCACARALATRSFPICRWSAGDLAKAPQGSRFQRRRDRGLRLRRVDRSRALNWAHLDNGFSESDPESLESSGIHIYFGTGNGYASGYWAEDKYEHPWEFALEFLSSQVADVNGDGRADLVEFGPTVLENGNDDPDGFDPQAEYDPESGLYEVNALTQLQARLGQEFDLNHNDGSMPTQPLLDTWNYLEMDRRIWSAEEPASDYAFVMFDVDANTSLDVQLYNAETHKFQFLTRTPSEAVAMRGEGQFPGVQIAKVTNGYGARQSANYVPASTPGSGSITTLLRANGHCAHAPRPAGRQRSRKRVWNGAKRSPLPQLHHLPLRQLAL